MKSSLLTFLSLISASCFSYAQVQVQYSEQFTKAFEQAPEAREYRMTSDRHSYRVLVHSRQIQGVMRPDYNPTQINQLELLLANTLAIKTENGLVQAANRDLEEGKKDETNYDAVWVRDSLWAYLALDAKKETQETAQKVILTLLKYYSTPDQLRRFQDVIANPQLLNDPKNGAMNAVHIRFDAKSPLFLDKMKDGAPQTWNHKQNDAIGLFFDLALRAILKNQIPFEKLQPDEWKALAYFPAYFARTRFYDMEDAGSWEEIERKNASSTGLVTSGLELLRAILSSKDARVKLFVAAYSKALSQKVGNIQLSTYTKDTELKKLIDLGYDRILKRLSLGGESPQYKISDPRYRQADAALLNLIYPARLSRLTLEDKHRVINLIQPLIGRVGIKRYLYDSYQSGNFWFTDTSGGDVDKRTDDTSSESSYLERGSKFIAGTEAQWFFDSWLSLCHGVLFKEGGAAIDRAYELEFLNRSLGQITSAHALNAEGNPVPSLALPESYNSLVSGNRQIFVPSPITPLNWAKASLLLALEQLK